MDTSVEPKVIVTPFYVVDMQKRSWRERLFSWPWKPWVKSYPVNTPSMVRVGNEIYCHPELLPALQKMLLHRKEAGEHCRNCEWTWDSATSNGVCEYCERRQWYEEEGLDLEGVLPAQSSPSAARA